MKLPQGCQKRFLSDQINVLRSSFWKVFPTIFRHWAIMCWKHFHKMFVRNVKTPFNSSKGPFWEKFRKKLFLFSKLPTKSFSQACGHCILRVPKNVWTIFENLFDLFGNWPGSFRSFATHFLAVLSKLPSTCPEEHFDLFFRKYSFFDNDFLFLSFDSSSLGRKKYIRAVKTAFCLPRGSFRKMRFPSKSLLLKSFYHSRTLSKIHRTFGLILYAKLSKLQFTFSEERIREIQKSNTFKLTIQLWATNNPIFSLNIIFLPGFSELHSTCLKKF